MNDLTRLGERTLTAVDLARCDCIAALGAGAVKPFVDAVSAATGIAARRFYSEERTAQISEARQLVMFVAHQSGVSIRKIALGLNRDRSTVLHGIRQEEQRRTRIEGKTL